MMLQKTPLTALDIKQKQLVKACFWDEIEQTLWIDCRKVFPEYGVVSVPSWDSLMMSSGEVPAYPASLRVLKWSNFSQLSSWRKQIPQWVQDSCALFPSHQLSLIHYSGKYPQILELLDHSPMLAWRLIASGLPEADIVVLLSGNRQQMVGQVGWPEKSETVKFLRNLRLRLVNDEIAEQIEVCLLDDQRLTALQALPRINSMALSLAARFPNLIGCRLHHALAQLPCRPMQCQSMIALLEDTYRLAAHLALPAAQLDRIGECRYLVEVMECYQAWLNQVWQQQTLASTEDLVAGFVLTSHPSRVLQREDWYRIGRHQQHAWWLDLEDASCQLLAWRDEDGVWAALIALDGTGDLARIVRVRGEENCLPGAKQLSDLHLWQARH